MIDRGFSEEIEELIKEVSRKDRAALVLFSVRCALRVFPLIVENDHSFSYWPEDKRVFNLLTVWRAVVAAMAGSYGDPKDSYNYAGNIFQVASDASNNPHIHLAYTAIANSIMAIYAYATEDKYLTTIVSTSAAASENSIASSRILNDKGDSEKKAQYNDLVFLMSSSREELSHAPLWLDVSPGDDYLSLLETALPAALEHLAEVQEQLSKEGRRLIRAIAPIYQSLYDRNFSQESLLYEYQELNTYFRAYDESYASTRSADNLANLGRTEEVSQSQENIKYQASQKFSHQNASTNDTLDRKKLVETLAGFLLHSANHHHQTIGLLGDWGIGKSSVVKQLRRLLIRQQKRQTFLFAEFNAWAYEHTDNLQAGVAQEVIKTLSECLPNGNRLLWIAKRFFLVSRFAIRLHGPKLLWLLFLLLLVVIPPFFGFFDQIWGSFFPDVKHAKEMAIMTGGVGFLFFFWKKLKPIFANPFAKELLTYLKLPSYGHHLGTIPVMRETIKTLCDIRLKNFGGEKRLLFVVDDLDRCGHIGIVKVLEAVRLVLDIPNVTVVIAVDQRIALAALALHYKELADYHELRSPKAIARDYLAKVIHLPITLSEPSQNSVHQYLHDIWSKTEEADNENTNNEDTLTGDHMQRHKNYTVIGRGEILGNSPLNQTTGDIKHQDETILDNSNVNNLGNINHDSGEADDQGNPVKIIARLSNMQKKSFLYWLDYFELTNPRQIKRLNNCYNLLRTYYDEDEQGIIYKSDSISGVNIYPIMLTLFALEYINGMDDVVKRKKLRSIICRENTNADKHNISENSKFTVDVLNILRSKFLQNAIVDLVEPFVLPAIEGE